MIRYYKSDEVIAIKTKKLDILVIAEVHAYLDKPGTPQNSYIKELNDVILSQLIIKAGYKIINYPVGVEFSEQQRLMLLAERLTNHFLKRKLDRIQQPEQLKFKEGSEILDPHHHLNSIYVKDNQHLLALLPDFGAIYVALRGGSGIKLNNMREQELRNQQGILTDVQFLGRSPEGYTDVKDSKRLNPTVGYVRGEKAGAHFKEGFIAQFASGHKNVCRCCDMCGPETKDSWKDLERYLNHTIRHKAEIIRIHIGETHIPQQGKDNVEQLFKLLELKRSTGGIIKQVIRLGHGTHMSFQSMRDCATHGYYVEACLSSNKETGIITKRSEYPLGPMLLLDVRVMIGTDGGDLYFTDLKKEYAYAKKNIHLFLDAVNKGGAGVVALPNGDKLLYQHVKHFFKNIPQANGWSDNKEIQFADLKLIEEACKDKINVHQLVDNMNGFKKKMFPGNTNQASLVDEKTKTTGALKKIDLSSVQLFTQNRISLKGPCIELSCKTKEQSEYIQGKLKKQNISVHEVNYSQGFWHVKFDKSSETEVVAAKIIGKPATLQAKKTAPRKPELVIENKYAYQTFSPSAGRNHFFAASVPKSVTDNVLKSYQAFRGDYLKNKILEDIKTKIQKINSKADFDTYKDTLMHSSEYTILKAGQGLFTRCTGKKTSSLAALEDMLKQIDDSINNPNLKI